MYLIAVPAGAKLFDSFKWNSAASFILQNDMILWQIGALILSIAMK
jgi:hypothetical protein